MPFPDKRGFCKYPKHFRKLVFWAWKSNVKKYLIPFQKVFPNKSLKQRLEHKKRAEINPPLQY
ncbi:hypothetical protein DR864_18265 [Runella rosea]|uniref:Uncharacterized protein n=1 Tax=Runella rosea TaxID=2259595 RepID=A0A344TLM2_9BACT|nr:hypothetical protein DR864_18265 [Runella rosea]